MADPSDEFRDGRDAMADADAAHRDMMLRWNDGDDVRAFTKARQANGTSGVMWTARLRWWGGDARLTGADRYAAARRVHEKMRGDSKGIWG